ncbi:MAG: hypothetical protein AB7F28_03940 [Candidatus Margulisiibacteriota bacterium]
MPSQQAIAEFKQLYQQHYGITLSDKEAFEKATSLLRLYKAVLEPTMKMKPDYAKEPSTPSHPR